MRTSCEVYFQLPTGFPIDLAYGKPAGNIRNHYHMTMEMLQGLELRGLVVTSTQYCCKFEQLLNKCSDHKVLASISQDIEGTKRSNDRNIFSNL